MNSGIFYELLVEFEKTFITKCSAIAAKRAAGCVIFGQKWKTELNWTELIYLVKRTQDVQGKKKCH